MANINNKKIFITGGAGYVGAALVPKLLSKGYIVTVYDLLIFGDDVLKKNPNLKIIKGDIRNTEFLSKYLSNHDIFIHLACISNDPSFDLNPKLGKSINFDSFEPMVKACKKSGVKLFIYASSSSVYGIKKEKNVHEDMSLEPLTDYSKYKAQCEKILKKYQSENFTTVVVRPATVCGFSNRQRMDVIVNLLTNQAFNLKQIRILGGKQLRPNIHIDDMVNVYLLLIDSPKHLVAGEIFNAGYQNLSVGEIANTVKSTLESKIELKIEKTDDLRSYHISSNKIKNTLKFKPKNSVEQAIRDLKQAFEKNLLPNSLYDEKYFNIKQFEKIDLK